MPVFVQAATDHGNSFETNLNVSFPAPVTPGNAVIVVYAGTNNNPTFTDNQSGNTYGGPHGVLLDVTAGQYILQKIALNVAATGTFTVTHSGAFVTRRITIIEVAGLGAAPTVSVLTATSSTTDPTVGPLTVPDGVSIAIAAWVSATSRASFAVVPPLVEVVNDATQTPFTNVGYVPLDSYQPGSVSAEWSDAEGSPYASARHIVVYTNEMQVVRPVATDTTGDWTPQPFGVVHDVTSDEDDGTYAQLVAADSPSTMVLELDTMVEPTAGDGQIVIRTRRS